MNKCAMCGSYAINLNSNGRDKADKHLCDVCYWRKRADPDYAQKCAEKALKK